MKLAKYLGVELEIVQLTGPNCATAPETIKMVRFDDDAFNVIALLSGQIGGIRATKKLLPSILKQSGTKLIEVKVSFGIVEHGIGIRKGGA